MVSERHDICDGAEEAGVSRYRKSRSQTKSARIPTLENRKQKACQNSKQAQSAGKTETALKPCEDFERAEGTASWHSHGARNRT